MFLLLLISPVVVIADAGSLSRQETVPATLWKAWNGDWLILLNLCLFGSVYIRGIRRLWRKAGTGHSVTRSQAAAFVGSLFVLFVALISPLHALSEELVSAHMVQHMLLMVVAAPLFVMGSPRLVCTWGLSTSWRSVFVHLQRSLDAAATGPPILLWTLYAATLWLWHMPVAYQAAVVDPFIHDAQHLSFFGVACYFWNTMLVPLRRRGLHPLTAVIALFSTSLHAMLLGIFMSLSPVIWYEAYADRAIAWGLSSLEDQQLAGLIMWMPSCLVYPAAAGVGIGRWLKTRSVIQERLSSHPLQEA